MSWWRLENWRGRICKCSRSMGRIDSRSPYNRLIHEKRLTPLKPITQVGLTALLLLVAGCQQNREAGENHRTHYFGFTTVTIPRTADSHTNVFVSEVSNSGISLGHSSLGIGYNRSREIVMPPGGGIYAEARTEADYERLKLLLTSFTNIPVCIIRKPPAR